MPNDKRDSPEAGAGAVVATARLEPASDGTPPAKPKDGWDKADVVAKILGSVLIPIALGWLGYYGNRAVQVRTSAENQSAREAAAKLKKQELAMTVLLSTANVPELRKWAAGVYSEEFGLSFGANKELEQTPLSSAVPKQATDLAKSFLGPVLLKPFRDRAGVWTIGWGHTEGVTEDTQPITLAQADQLLAEDLQVISDQISPLIKVPLTENRRAALIDFAYGVGVRAFANSGLLIALNHRDYAAAGEQFSLWVRLNGQVNTALKARREREAALWDEPDPRTDTAKEP